MRNQKKTHLGENVRHLREAFGLKQEALAARLGEGWSQKKISVLESRADIDDDDLKQLAEGLGVGVEHIKKYDHEKVKNFIQNYYGDYGQNNAQNGQNNHGDHNVNPQHIEKVDHLEQKQDPSVEKSNELISQIKSLYDDLLKSEREKITLLEKLLESYKKM
ncbi:helix-turn-helix domain-containing protein [Fulvivirgaceae bacterium PWU37]|uniref:Helix-turn-helix domain-containing protein n=2 Tax=Dawidia soli TaxID=2782352 RepID=A0AAP2GI92_9BACT|nr:helix-turn-helix domain-containing protein [Dawidia soli]